MSNLKPFDLARWKAGDEVMYRDGKEVLDMHYFDHEQANFPIHALAWDGSFTEHLSDGRFAKLLSEHPRDIVMKPKIVKYYFASWLGDKSGIRHTSRMFTNNEIIQSWHNRTSAENPLIHEIEIEE